jgi:DcaP outer membrane protein
MATTGSCALLALSLCLAGPAAAQEPPQAATSVTAARKAVDDLRRVLDDQRALIERQAARLEAQEAELAALRKRVDEVGTLALGASNAVAELKQQPTAPTTAAAIEQRLQAIEQSVQRAPEMLRGAVSAGEFPGSIRVPGTDAAFKVGGQARMSLVHTLAPLGVDDRFITSSIPVDQETAGDASRTNYSASPSRLNLDLRSPSRLGDVRTFLEWDFAGTGNAARLRHAFIQAKRWTIGQTWSTFSDPEAEPIGIDFEGLNAISLFRQPQIRFTQPFRGNLSAAFAIENPAPDLTDAQGVNATPDFVARLRWEPPKGVPGPHLLGRTAHVQAAILVRTLRGELTDQPDTTLSTGGFGANISGVLVPRWDTDDRFKFAVNSGWGIGRYITDLGTLGGQDAVYDPVDNSLRSLPAYSAYLGYERAWKPTFTSAFTYGLVRVSNLDIQPADALRETQRATLNLTWAPIQQFEVVVEFLTGRRVNKDGDKGASSQIQGGWTFRF